MANREMLQQAMTEGNQAAVLGIALGLINVGDEGLPTGTHRLAAGMAQFALGQYHEASQTLEAAAELLPLGSLERARAMANSAIAHLRLGTAISARRVATRVLTEFAGLPGQDYCRQVGAAHHVIGCVAEMERDYPVAAQSFHLAAGIYPDPWRKLSAQAMQAWVLALWTYHKPEERTALGLAQKLLEGLDEAVLATYPPGQFGRLVTWALVKHVQGDHLGALESGDQALAIDVAGKDHERAELLVWLCRAALAANDIIRARRYLRQARGLWNSTHSFVWDAIMALEGEIGVA